MAGGLATAVTIDIQKEKLVALYRFDEGTGSTAEDSAVLEGAQTATQNQGSIGWTPGLIGGALNLDGASSLVTLSDALTNGVDAFTLSAWVKLPAPPTTGYKGIFLIKNPANTWGLAVKGVSNAPVYEFRYDAPAEGAGSSTGKNGPAGTVATDQWQHIAMTWTADRSLRDFFIDGVDVGNAGTSGVRDDYNGGLSGWALHIGDEACCAGRELLGQVDEVAVWETALSASEIQSIYTNGLLGIGLEAPMPPPAGDANDDGFVDQADFEIIRANFGRDGFAEGVTLGRIDGDLVNDNVIDFDDYGDWKQATKGPIPGSSALVHAVPEPSTFLLLVLSTIGSAFAVRRSTNR
ncbi:LamG-like jellyroll fold domain-containing protein [Aeoliella sp. SH292]|uniref:LamG-like jellyroll fold domain-containing protein n=1 Tax=Aeoliella sp. SH292 TaxID=3454464 RepID=UPI003F9C5EAA